MGVLKKIIKKTIEETYINFLEKIAKEKYKRSHLCTITTMRNDLFYMIADQVAYLNYNENTCKILRTKCGEYMLTRYGLPQTEEEIPQVILVLTLSAIRKLGLDATIKFLTNWHGDSKVGEQIVVKYSVMF